MFENTRIYKICEKIIAIDDAKVFDLVLDTKLVKDFIIDLNTETQLKTEHVDSLGLNLFNKYSNSEFYSYSDEKGRGGQRYEVYNSGAYYDSFRVTIGNYVIQIDSDPIKQGGDSLFDMYTENLEGLTDSSKEALIKLVRELYVKWIRKYLEIN